MMYSGNVEPIVIPKPEEQPDTPVRPTPEKPNEQPIKVPNPFIVPKPKIQPGTEPAPKA